MLSFVAEAANVICKWIMLISHIMHTCECIVKKYVNASFWGIGFLSVWVKDEVWMNSLQRKDEGKLIGIIWETFSEENNLA